MSQLLRQVETLTASVREIEEVPVVAAVASVHDNKLLHEMGDMVLHKLEVPGVRLY